MLADASKYQQLQLAKEDERKNFEQALGKCRVDHENQVSIEKEQHRKEMEFRNTQITELLKDIERTKKRNEHTLSSIQEDTKYEIDDIIKKNQNNQTQVNDMKLKSTAEYQLANNKLDDISKDNNKL